MKVTEFGKAVRRARISLDLRLKDMADGVGVSSSFLSAVESGSRTLTWDFVQRIAGFLDEHGGETGEVLEAARKTINEVTVPIAHQNELESEVAMMFARRLSGLSQKQMRSIKKVLEETE